MDTLATVTGNTDYLTVHVDDQMDSKSLLGTYIASSVAGEFNWQPGLLCQVPHRYFASMDKCFISFSLQR